MLGMIIYVDVVFIENLILDFIILFATEIICNNKFNFFRLIFGSFIGSLFTVISFILGINSFILKIVFSFLIVLIAFGYKNKKIFIKNLGVFFLTTITFGGSSFMFMFLVDSQKIVLNEGHFLGLYPVKMALIRRNFWIFFDSFCFKKYQEKISKILWYRNLE